MAGGIDVRFIGGASVTCVKTIGGGETVIAGGLTMREFVITAGGTDEPVAGVDEVWSDGTGLREFGVGEYVAEIGEIGVVLGAPALFDCELR